MSENLNQKANHPAKNRAGEGADNNGKKKVAPFDNKTILILVLEVFGVGVFGFLLNLFFSTDHKAWGIVFTFLSIASLVAIFATTAATKYSHTKVWTAYALSHVALGDVPTKPSLMLGTNRLRMPQRITDPVIQLRFFTN